MVNPRAVALTIGLLGACAGILALVLSEPLLGLVAGVLAVGAGALAFAVRTDTTELEQRLALHRAAEDDLGAKVAERDEQLAQAREQLERLETDLAEAAVRNAAAATPSAVPTDDPASLTDQDSQLFSEAYFKVALDARIASARRHLRPVAIALIDVYEGVAGSGAGPANPSRAAESIRETVRDADTACRLGDGTFAIILEDTPENGAVWTVERVRRNLVSRFGSHTMWAGVACYPAHAFSADELLDQARLALGSAREWKQDRIEVAIAE